MVENLVQDASANDGIYFDLEDVVASEIEPLIEQINQFCQKHKLPFIFSICYGADEAGAKIITAGLDVGTNDPTVYRAFWTLVDNPELVHLIELAKIRIEGIKQAKEKKIVTAKKVPSRLK
jgi:hypothetical protein